MADFSLPALPQKVVPRVLARLARVMRKRPARPSAIDPDTLSEHLQRDLGFRDGRSGPVAGAEVDRFTRR